MDPFLDFPFIKIYLIISALLVRSQFEIAIRTKVNHIFAGVNHVRNPAAKNTSDAPETTGCTNSTSPYFMIDSCVACIVAARTTHVNTVIGKHHLFLRKWRRL